MLGSSLDVVMRLKLRVHIWCLCRCVLCLWVAYRWTSDWGSSIFSSAVMRWDSNKLWNLDYIAVVVLTCLLLYSLVKGKLNKYISTWGVVVLSSDFLTVWFMLYKSHCCVLLYHFSIVFWWNHQFPAGMPACMAAADIGSVFYTCSLHQSQYTCVGQNYSGYGLALKLVPVLCCCWIVYSGWRVIDLP